MRDAAEPAPTIYFGQRANGVRWELEEGLVVSTGNNTARAHGGDWRAQGRPFERSVDHPAPTLDTRVDGKWRVHPPGERVIVERGPRE